MDRTAHRTLAAMSGPQACERPAEFPTSTERSVRAPRWWSVGVVALLAIAVAEGRWTGAPKPRGPPSNAGGALPQRMPNSRSTPAAGWDWTRAGVRELRALPGVGEVRALTLARARWRGGAQAALDHLEEQPGFGPITAERVRRFLGPRAWGLRPSAEDSSADARTLLDDAWDGTGANDDRPDLADSSQADPSRADSDPSTSEPADPPLGATHTRVVPQGAGPPTDPPAPPKPRTSAVRSAVRSAGTAATLDSTGDRPP